LTEKFTIYYALPDGKKFIVIEKTGQVYDDNYQYISSGGYTCIQSWLMDQQFAAKYQVVKYNQWVFHYYPETGHAHWANGTEVSKGGLGALKKYI